jgi:hypothetical protein
MVDVPARDIGKAPGMNWLPAVELSQSILKLEPDTTGLAEELRAALTETTDDV